MQIGEFHAPRRARHSGGSQGGTKFPEKRGIRPFATRIVEATADFRGFSKLRQLWFRRSFGALQRVRSVSARAATVSGETDSVPAYSSQRRGRDAGFARPVQRTIRNRRSVWKLASQNNCDDRRRASGLSRRGGYAFSACWWTGGRRVSFAQAASQMRESCVRHGVSLARGRQVFPFFTRDCRLGCGEQASSVVSGHRRGRAFFAL